MNPQSSATSSRRFLLIIPSTIMAISKAKKVEILATLEGAGITNINKIVKKEFQPLVLEARALALSIPVDTEKARKAGLGGPNRILSKAQLALIAPAPEPVKAPEVGADGKAAKAVVLDEDGNKIDVEEVENEDVHT